MIDRGEDIDEERGRGRERGRRRKDRKEGGKMATGPARKQHECRAPLVKL